MACNIYEDPSLITDVKYSKRAEEDGGEGVERLVDIYESVNAAMEHHVGVSSRHRGAHSHKCLLAAQRNHFRAAALALGLLCILLLMGSIVLSTFFIKIALEKEQLRIFSNKLQISYNILNNDYCQTHGNATDWKRFRCSCYYKSADMKSWSESRKDCQSRGADLVIINSKEEQEFVSKINEDRTSWIGLQSQKGHNWDEVWQWKWVDGSTPGYLAWSVEVGVNPEVGSKAYTDIKGKWKHTKDGSKQWICEKNI